MALNNLGLALREVRRFDEAITACRDAAAIYRETGDRHGEGIALDNLGLALREMRRFEEAITAYQDAAGDRPGDRRPARRGRGAGQPRRGPAGGAAVRGGDHRAQDAAAIYRETGDRHGEGIALDNLGLALEGVRRFEEAITACQDAAAIHRETGDRHGEGMASATLALALREVRRFEEAITACQDAAAIFRETGDRHGEAGAEQPRPRPAEVRAVRRGDHRTPGRRGRLPGNRRPARRGRGAEQPRPGPAGGAAVRRGDHRLPGRRRHLPRDRRPVRRGTALNNLGVALQRGATVRRGDHRCRDAAAIYRETGDRHGEGGAVQPRPGPAGGAAVRRGDHRVPGRRRHLPRDRRPARRGQRWRLGATLWRARRLDETITVQRAAAARFRETGDRHGEAGRYTTSARPGRYGDSTRRSPRAGRPRPSTVRPATGTARPQRWTASAPPCSRCGGSTRRSPRAGPLRPASGTPATATARPGR